MSKRYIFILFIIILTIWSNSQISLIEGGKQEIVDLTGDEESVVIDGEAKNIDLTSDEKSVVIDGKDLINGECISNFTVQDFLKKYQPIKKIRESFDPYSTETSNEINQLIQYCIENKVKKIPIPFLSNKHYHWVLVMIFEKKNTYYICYYDSLKKENETLKKKCLQVVSEPLQKITKNIEIYDKQLSPKQNDTISCGLFVLINMYICLYKITFQQLEKSNFKLHDFHKSNIIYRDFFYKFIYSHEK